MRPLILPLANKVELVNDTFIILCSYFLIIFSGLVADAETRYTSGWPLIGLIALLIGFNFTTIMVTAISQVIHSCKLRCLRRKNRREMLKRM